MQTQVDSFNRYLRMEFNRDEIIQLDNATTEGVHFDSATYKQWAATIHDHLVGESKTAETASTHEDRRRRTVMARTQVLNPASSSSLAVRVGETSAGVRPPVEALQMSSAADKGVATGASSMLGSRSSLPSYALAGQRGSVAPHHMGGLSRASVGCFGTGTVTNDRSKPDHQHEKATSGCGVLPNKTVPLEPMMSHPRPSRPCKDVTSADRTPPDADVDVSASESSEQESDCSCEPLKRFCSHCA